MDAHRFDTLTRALTTAGSRRRALALALTGALAPLLGLGETEAHNKLKKCKKIEDKDKRQKCVKKAKRHNKSRHKDACRDGVKNGIETDIDCGGGTCPRCAAGKICNSRNDCATGLCVTLVCQPCANAGDCGNDADGATACACRTHESGQKFCTKNGTGDVRVLPAGTPCTACQGEEQCFPINGGADGIECIRPCGAA